MNITEPWNMNDAEIKLAGMKLARKMNTVAGAATDVSFDTDTDLTHDDADLVRELCNRMRTARKSRAKKAEKKP